MKDFTTFFLAECPVTTNANTVIVACLERSLCPKFKIFPDCTLLIITFSIWCNFNQLSPAQWPCVAFLDPERTTPCMSYIQPSYVLPGLWLLAQDQLSDTWSGICLPWGILNTAHCQSVSFCVLTAAQTRLFGLEAHAVLWLGPSWGHWGHRGAATLQSRTAVSDQANSK